LLLIVSIEVSRRYGVDRGASSLTFSVLCGAFWCVVVCWGMLFGVCSSIIVGGKLKGGWIFQIKSMLEGWVCWNDNDAQDARRNLSSRCCVLLE
jgi:hypothetical protein